MVERAESFYTPWRVKKIVREWDHYVAVEENGSAARGLLIQGPTPETPSAGARQKGHHADPMRGVPVVADVLRAWKALGPETDEYRVVAWRLFLYSEASVPRPSVDLNAILDRACERMAAFLGWEPESEAMHPFQSVRACEQCGQAIVGRSDAKYCSDRCRVRAWRGVGATATATG